MPELTFMDLLALHIGYVVSSLIIVAVFLGLMILTAYISVLVDGAVERRARRRKEALRG